MLGLGLGLWSNVAAQSGGGGGGSAATWATTNGVNKNSTITLTNGNLTETPSNSFNWQGIRASRATTGTGSWTATIGTPSEIIVGIDDGTTDFTNDNPTHPGDGNTSGVTFLYHTSGVADVYYGGQTQVGLTAPAGATSIQIVANKSAGTVAFKIGGTQYGPTITGVSFANWYAVALGLQPSEAVTADFTGY